MDARSVALFSEIQFCFVSAEVAFAADHATAEVLQKAAALPPKPYVSTSYCDFLLSALVSNFTFLVLDHPGSPKQNPRGL